MRPARARLRRQAQEPAEAEGQAGTPRGPMGDAPGACPGGRPASGGGAERRLVTCRAQVPRHARPARRTASPEAAAASRAGSPAARPAGPARRTRRRRGTHLRRCGRSARRRGWGGGLGHGQLTRTRDAPPEARGFCPGAGTDGLGCALFFGPGATPMGFPDGAGTPARVVVLRVKTPMPAWPEEAVRRAPVRGPAGAVRHRPGMNRVARPGQLPRAGRADEIARHLKQHVRIAAGAPGTGIKGFVISGAISPEKARGGGRRRTLA